MLRHVLGPILSLFLKKKSPLGSIILFLLLFYMICEIRSLVLLVLLQILTSILIKYLPALI